MNCDSECDLVVQEMEECIEMAHKQIGLEESQLEFKKQQNAQKKSQQLIMDGCAEKILKLDEKGLNVEQQRAKFDREGHKSLVADLQGLAEKVE